MFNATTWRIAHECAKGSELRQVLQCIEHERSTWICIDQAMRGPWRHVERVTYRKRISAFVDRCDLAACVADVGRAASGHNKVQMPECVAMRERVFSRGDDLDSQRDTGCDFGAVFSRHKSDNTALTI